MSRQGRIISGSVTWKQPASTRATQNVKNTHSLTQCLSPFCFSFDDLRFTCSRYVNLIIIILTIKFVYGRTHNAVTLRHSATATGIPAGRRTGLSVCWLAARSVGRTDGRTADRQYDIHTIACSQAIKSFTRSCGNTSLLPENETTNGRKIMSEIDLELSKRKHERTKERKTDKPATRMAGRNSRGPHHDACQPQLMMMMMMLEV